MTRITKKLPRWKEDNAVYFITFCTFKRRKLLHKKAVAQILLDDLVFYKKCVKEIIAYTIMPDHVHMLIDVEKATNLSIFLQRFKSHSSKMIYEVLKINSDHIWQRGTMDHCIRDELDFDNHLKYIFFNSFKHLNVAPKNFNLHNFKEIVEKGWMEEDYCDFSKEKEQVFARYE